MNDSWLVIAGYHRDGKGMVLNRVNGLPFGLTDAEHWLCKSWVLARKTFNHYRNSLYPIPLQPFYHPIRFRGAGVPDSIRKDKVMDTIMKEVTDSFEQFAVEENCQSKKFLKLPQVLVM